MSKSNAHKTVHIDEADRGLCYYCGRPAALKVGLWSEASQAREDNKQSWRAVLICKNCNERHKWVDELELPDTYIGY